MQERPPHIRKTGRARRICWACWAAAALVSGVGAHAQDYPARPIRVIVPFSPGGSTDFSARILQPGLADALGQPIVIDNRPGAGGNIAVEIATRAAPDGYTLLFGNVGTIVINPVLFKKFPIDPLRDLTCINIVSDVSSMLVVNSSIPAATVREFIDYAKTRPGQINYAVASVGSMARLGMELLAQKAGIKLTMIPYKGAADVVIGLLRGDAAVAFVAVPPVIPHIKSGKLRGLASRASKRLDAFPALPTLSEAGFPELGDDSWQGLYVTAGTPVPIVRKLHAAIAKILRDPRTAESMRAGAATVINSDSPESCAAFTKSQTELWANFMRQLGLAGIQ